MAEYQRIHKATSIQFTGKNIQEIIDFVNCIDKHSVIVEKVNDEYKVAVGNPSCNGHCLPLAGAYILDLNQWIIIEDKNPKLIFMSDKEFKQWYIKKDNTNE